MSFQMKIDEMLDALCNMGHHEAAALTTLVETTANTLSAALCKSLLIECDPASFQGAAFAGTCVPFYPALEGQELPPEIAPYDDKEEWGE
ncbi:hypothetical protein [Rhizobium sp. Leaf383]|uniref:hypothetical protein n=1 Tax=Rhizobium sp. Leaf383 TaxID=1736357 RepID=UPI000715A4FC|nr:hypothetical protein [Rhizobium sp. Leaf383]KQS84297.1 hypothetical protein ASG58_21240 [Rhizobium sp. Leaf383]